MIKGILFDIDDTLFSHKIEAVPTLTLKALKKLKKAGIKLGVCTSREPAEMKNLSSNFLDLFDCLIMCTGATTMVSQKYMKAYTIDINEARKYVAYFKQNNISYDYSDINGDKYYYGDLDNFKSNNFMHLSGGKEEGRIFYKEYEDEEITNITYFHATDKQRSEIAAINPDLYISYWGSCGKISGQFIDKSFGVLKFCQQFNFTTDEVMAVGDGGNDDIMLKMADIGIAVKDGKENTLKAADYVCKKSIEDGGIYEALIDLGIIEEDKYEPKIFFFDIDSTSFDHSIGGVRESTYQAFAKLKEKGYKLCVNTSRSYKECYNVPQKYLDYMDCLSLLSGAYIIKDGKTVYQTIDHEDCKRIAKYLDERGLTYRYATVDGGGYLNQHDKEHEQLFYDLYHMVPEIKEYQGEEVLSFLYYTNGQQREDIITTFANQEHARIGEFAGEIYPKGIDKGLIIPSIAQMYGFSSEETCAFGDGGNDVSMLKCAKLGVAMGNGVTSCKQAADYVTDDISDEGLYNALVHFNIIQED